MINIHNPILPGFHPDPSIIRVDEDFYIATSTFEWFPGVRIHHSRDLENWELIDTSLDKLSQLDMRGAPDSCGVWAPCLTYWEGTYYLVYSNVKSFEPLWGQTPNYLVTTTDLKAGWSDPIFLSNEGFDGSFFHDANGRKWFLSLRLDAANENIFGGIILQEYSMREKRLIGKPQVIFEGTELGMTEGPHLYQLNGYYYLVTAEGGTEYDHAVSIARAKEITGPYEPSPYGPIVHTKGHPSWPLQKTGHGDLVEDGQGNWYVVFLTGRPLTQLGRCTLGRETAMEEVVWQEGWPVMKSPSDAPRLQIGNPGPVVAANTYDDFKTEVLHPQWQSLREPVTKAWLTLGSNGLTLLGRQSLQSWESQSLIARRVTAFDIEVTTELIFKPGSSDEAAGLVFYYNSGHYHYLHMTFDEGPILRVLTCDRRQEYPVTDVPISAGPVQLKGHFIRNAIRFFWKQGAADWQPIGDTLDGSILSDDYVQHDNGTYKAAFTGAFAGLCCQDLSGGGAIARFRYFEYVEHL